MGFLQTSFINPQCLKYFHNFVLKKTIQCSNVLLYSQSTKHVFPASYMTFTKQVTSQHHSTTHPKTSKHLFAHTKSCSWFLKERKSFSSTTVKNAKNPSVIVKYTQDINLDELKEQVKKERQTTPTAQVITKIKEVLAEKCDQAIANLNEEEKKALKVIQLEHSFMFSQGYFIPSCEEMKNENWLEAMGIDSKMQRLKYYIFLKKKLMIKAAEKEKPKKELTNTTTHQQSGLSSYEHGRLFMRIYDTTIKKWQNNNLASAMQFGIPLVIDMDYHDFMRTQDAKNTAVQLFALYSLNRSDTTIPFHLHFTNCPENNPLYRLMQFQMQDTPDMMATVTEKSYLDLFDKGILVYLSPDAKQVMTKFDPEAVYIIGAFNDKGTQQPVSYARAKKQGIKAMRFPLDQYLNWNLGSKSITLDQVMQIMTSVKNNESWLDAFKSIPKRKIRS